MWAGGSIEAGLDGLREGIDEGLCAEAEGIFADEEGIP